MAEGKEEVLRKVVERLARMASPKTRSVPITLDTEVYRDLGIYGDEIVDLVVWLSEEFGIAGVTSPFVYAPREFPYAFPFLEWFCAVTRALGIGAKPHYKSLKVRDLIAAIEAKRWPE
jgi:hypothetical protein